MSISGSCSARRGSSRTALLAGVSSIAVSVGLVAPAAAATAPRTFSPAWFAARVDASTGASVAGSSSSTLAQVTTATRNLATLATRLQAMEAAQQAAASAAASAASVVPNGLAAGGLQIISGATAGSSSWSGADLPTQTEANGRAEVAVKQTASQAMLTWQTFNVGSKTDLTFDQSAGGSNAANWVVLNRVEDPAAVPSQVLGSITAPGKVYIINASGIVFGAGSQVNLGALIASTADISNAQFASGIYGAVSGASYLPSFTQAAVGSAVIVDQGALITTAAPSSVTADGGSVMLFGDVVENDGEIDTPQGQTVLAGGRSFVLRPGYSSTGNQTATVVGNQVATQGGPGSVTNNGLITSDLGDITLVGHEVTQAGIVLSTTSVNTRGTVHLLDALDDTGGSITLAPGSITTVDPDNAATTALDTQRDGLITQSAANNALRQNPVSATNPQLDDVGTLSDRLDESRIEITTGGTVAFEANSLTLSQGGQIAVQAGRTAQVDDGAALDVSGSTGAVLPMSSNALTVNIQGNELRDAPVNRDTGLISSDNVSLDIRDLVDVAASSSDASARTYSAGGLLEVSGYVANIGHTIDEWAATGGTITLAAPVAVTAPLSNLNVAGGSVTVQGGELAQSYLIGADGNLYNANTAPANIEYVGVYGGFTVDYTRFGGSDTYVSPVAAPAEIYQSGYSYGRDAGSVIVSAPTAVLEGTIEAGVSNGSQQTTARPAAVTDPYTLSQSTIAMPGTLAIGGFDSAGNLLSPYVTISDTTVPVADQIITTGTLPAGIANTVTLSASQLNSEALGGLSVITGTFIAVTAPVTLAPGGTLTLHGAGVAVGANLTARGGRISIGDELTNPVTGVAVTLLPSTSPDPADSGGGVSIHNGATLDLRGEWTNAISDPSDIAGEALVNGGTLTIDSIRALNLAAGTAIDASSGGALLTSGKQIGGTGGDVTLVGDDPLYGTSASPVIMDATLRDAGVDGGGTLSLTVPGVIIGTSSAALAPNTVLLAAETFQSGFSDYVINGTGGLSVLPGTVVAVAEPIYTFYQGDMTAPIGAPTGADPSAVFQLILPQLYAVDRANAKLTQRKGASVAFISNDRPGQADFGGGAISIGAGSSITVDPGQSVRVEAYGQITDDGAITARGGSVSIVNEQRALLTGQFYKIENTLSLSVWIGGDALIDVAGLATTDTDAFGRSFGSVTAGGDVTLGSDAGVDASDSQVATDAFVLVRPGAVIDAAGASAGIDLLAGTTPQLDSLQATGAATDPVVDASSGGSIAARSYSGIALDGTLLAAAGGAGAAGGTLSMTLETPVYAQGTVVPIQLRRTHLITISNQAQSIAADTTLQAGQALAITSYGRADISRQQIIAGGFGALSLYARDAFVFDGSVSLNLSSSITLSQGILSDRDTSAVVTIAAPYVQLTGETPVAGEGVSVSVNNAGWHPFAHDTTSTFTVDADLIDVADALRFGVSGSIARPSLDGSKTTRAVDLAGFADVDLNSTGAIEFDTGSLTTPGNVTLSAAQIYPTTGSVAAIYAGYDEYHHPRNLFVPSGSITVLRTGTATPPVPYSIGGSLALYAGAVIQDGVIQAPEGTITLGGVGIGPSGELNGQSPTDSFTYSVSLLPGSITSVSLDGATVPYGGTVDGVSYTFNGTAVGSFNPAITLSGQTQSVAAGALLDLSGGGTLSGAGFISGRGGSTDVLTNPLLVFDAATGKVSTATLASEPVYAIVPGYGSAYAPSSAVQATAGTGSVPAIGSQITIGTGIPGIAAGTYTLLPAYYALLPGAARVQIDTGAYDTTPGVTVLGAGSYQLNATTSIANTGVQAALPVQVVVTTAAGVALNSQYDQETYSQFELAQAAQFGTPRASLPEDGKTLNLVFPAFAATTTALHYDGTADFAAITGYYAGEATVGGLESSLVKLEITADGAAPAPGNTGIEASALDALGAPRLVIGGTLSPDKALPLQLDFIGTVDVLTVDSGAVLRGPELFLVSGAAGHGPDAGGITVDDGAVLDTVGQGAPPFDSAAGYVYNAFGYTLVALSNGQLTFTPSISSQVAFGAITIDSGASLFTQGTLNFATDKSLTLSDMANYGASTLSFDVDTINVVSDAAQAAAQAGTLILPSGLTLTQDVLTRLLNGDPASGTPALQSLVLTANQSINFAGSVSLDTLNATTGQSSLQQLVLNTPAIYGAGGAGDTATITTGTLYWNGVAATTTLGTVTTPSSALPGGVVANGPGTGSGTLDIIANSIVLGYGPDTPPNDQLTLDRLIEGFATVDLNASTSISGADRGTLSVYQSAGATYGSAGNGGALNIATPLLTGAAGSVDGITAGGALTIAGLNGVSTATTGALGAELDLDAASISDLGAIVLNSGRLTMTAAIGDLDITAGARIELAGQAVTLLDQTRYSPGGSLVLASAAGNIATDTASSIDVSATNAAAGSVQATAADAADFAGTITGAADAGQTSGAFSLRAGTLADFDALNATLDAGGVFASRSFDIASGDITVDQTVQAQAVSITADSGSLTVTGTINASGAAPGSIALAAGGDLTIAGGAVLDAHGTVLQTDSTGAAIEAENRASVALTTASGTLTLGDATIDVSSADALAFGQVILTAPRSVAGGVETGDIAIDASGTVGIIGAEDIVLYGSRTYTPTDANGTIEQHADPTIAGSISLDQINADNTMFMKAALAPGSALSGQTTGLAAYGSAYQVAPADIIQSSAASDGNLTVNGDLDLSTLRYGPDVSKHVAGSGEAGLLTLRAANNLVVNGSISDGFATPADAATPTPDDNGWVLYSSEPLGQAVTLPTDLAKPVVLANGTNFTTGNAVALNYDITIASATLGSGVVIPTSVVTAKSYSIPAGGLTATAAITGPNGAVIAVQGQVLAAGTVIPDGSTLGVGSVLPFAVKVADHTVWPAGASLSLFSSPIVQLSMAHQGTLTLDGGAYIPIGTNLVFDSGASSVKLRGSTNGQQGLIYAVADMLPAGSQSWSINLVGGANLASANLLAVQPLTALAAAAGTATDPAGSVVLSDTHYTLANKYLPTTSFSVVRTGTGTLNLVAGGDVDEASLFGIYTAGSQTSLGGKQDAQFQAGRALEGTKGTLLGTAYAKTYATVIAGQLQYYPDHGGDVLVSAQGDVTGDIVEPASGAASDGTDAVGNWLWKQGGSGIGQSTAWWINFGSYVLPLDAAGNAVSSQPVLAGFTGIGALGGGNVTVSAGQDAGEVASINSEDGALSQGLVIAVASTGRVSSGGTTTETGGGALVLDVAGSLNPSLQSGTGTDSIGPTLGGTLTDMRGDTTVDAGAVGRIDLAYDVPHPTDPRPESPFTTEFAVSSNGLIVVPGDGTVSIDTLRDLVLEGAGDPGREPEQAQTAIAAKYLPADPTGQYAGDTGFSLWTDATAIDLFSAGGNLTPTTSAANGVTSAIANDAQTDYRFIYPATLDAVAASGSFYYGQQGQATNSSIGYSLELAPSATGELSFLAANSIYANGYAVDMSGAPDGLTDLSNPTNPAYSDQVNTGAPGAVIHFLLTSGNYPSPEALFAFEADTPTGDLHAGDIQPARIYAATGDLVDVQFGEVLDYSINSDEPVSSWYLAAKPAWIMAGNDIVSSGTRPSATASGYASSTFVAYPNQELAPASDVSSGNLLLNLTSTDVSVVSAGRDILSSYFYVAGPGLLEVDAGRNIDETGDNSLDFGVLKSVGPVFDIDPTTRSGGAAISVVTGAGSIGPDYSTFSNLYLNAGNQANLAIPLSDPANDGKVQQTYQDQLYSWLQQNYGYTGTEANALAYFDTLPTVQQDVFDRSVFYQELNASGLQESDPSSLFYKSYDRGRTAIATLFPSATPAGQAITYDGSLTMDSGALTLANGGSPATVDFDAGISTLYGGAVQILSPGGGDVFGTVGGPVPGASSGVVTSGSGDIDIYALDSVLLGQSRIFTTFGGNILIWSAQGDINAGRGSKTTVLYQPPLTNYDPYGSITFSPAPTTSGAGIATLAPIAGTVAGDVNLIAPLGTIDAGEAGIRVSGNLNISALTVLNAANVQTLGKTTGNTVTVSTNVAAATAAASAAGSSVNASTNSTSERPQQKTQLPSVITVDVIGGSDNDDDRRRRRSAA